MGLTSLGEEFSGPSHSFRPRGRIDMRPGRPVENSYIESFNGGLRDECLNIEIFFALADVRDKLECWRQDYNRVRPLRQADGQTAPGTIRQLFAYLTSSGILEINLGRLGARPEISGQTRQDTRSWRAPRTASCSTQLKVLL
jgi:hypothetical protein